MNYFRLSIAIVVSAFLFTGSVYGGMFDDFNFSGTFESVYWDHDPDDWDEETDSLYDGPYKSWENILSLNIDWKEWYAEIRLRSMDYTDAIHYDPKSREHETDFELFKIAAGYRHEYFTVTAGDFYKSLAHGIVMYVQEDKELNIDRTLRGGMLDITTQPVDISLFGGEIDWYRFKDDILDLTYTEYEITDKIFGGRFVVKLPFDIRLGGSYTQSEVMDIIQDELVTEDLAVGGVDLELSGLFGGKLDFYTEYARMKWDEDMPFGEELDDGEALYSSLTAYLGDFTVLAEYKDYDYWEYRYARPPTADRDDEAAEVNDIKGLRLKVDYFLPASNTLIYVSGGRFDNHAHETSWGTIIRNRIEHIYGGIEQTWEKLYAHITYGNKEFTTLHETHRRITGDFVYNLNSKNSLNLYYEYKFTGNENPDTGAMIAEKVEHKSYLTHSLSPWLAVTAHYNRHIISQANRDDDKEDWFAGEVVVTPSFDRDDTRFADLLSGLSLSIIYGELPPGLICSGGQCRIVPAFEGIQATVTYRF
jgi:Family of unknown function (DUF6029)